MKSCYYESGLSPEQKDKIFLKAIIEGKFIIDPIKGEVVRDNLRNAGYFAYSKGKKYFCVTTKIETGKYVYIPRARLIWIYVNGSIEEGKVVMRKDHNTTHNDAIDNLYIGTMADIKRRGANKRDLSGTNFKRILTDDTVKQIRYLREERKMSFRQIAKFVDTSKENVYAICNYTTWKEITYNVEEFNEDIKATMDALPLSGRKSSDKPYVRTQSVKTRADFNLEKKESRARKPKTDKFHARVPILEEKYPKTIRSIKRIVSHKDYHQNPESITEKFVNVFITELKSKIPKHTLKALFKYYGQTSSV